MGRVAASSSAEEQWVDEGVPWPALAPYVRVGLRSC
jgi:hypothetical protein